MGHVRKRMVSAGDRQVARYQARYIGPDGHQRARTFDRQADAERWWKDQEAAIRRGEWVDADAGRITVAEWSVRWLATKQHRKASTIDLYHDVLTSRILPRFGDRPVNSIARLDLEEWISSMQAEGLSASRIRNVVQPVKMMLDLAVEHGLIARNPARARSAGSRTGQLELPRVRRRAHRFLSADELAGLASAARSFDPTGPITIYTLGYGGMRWSELVALQRRDLDLLRARMTVVRNGPEVSGEHRFDSTKTDAVSTPRLPRFVADMVGEHLASRPPGSDSLVFGGASHVCAGRACDALRYDMWRRTVFAPAAAAAGLAGLKIHELRHTCASLLIAAGVDPKAVQEQLGHTSIRITLDVYGHLFERHLDPALDVLDQAGRRAVKDVRRTSTSSNVIEMTADRSGR